MSHHRYILSTEYPANDSLTTMRFNSMKELKAHIRETKYCLAMSWIVEENPRVEKGIYVNTDYTNPDSIIWYIIKIY